MNALKRELRKRGIIYDTDEYEVLMRGAEYDTCEQLVSVTETAVITVFYSAVLDPILRLYDRRTLAPIGEQDMFPSRSFKGNRTWGSFAYKEG